ncbi:sensor histidine kinase [Cellulomonas denverensis]|uniref:histidine kinase n=1 Tax=Cellulomonas denverensis TaxID=264297 RepID=A0A7X6QXP3_9CELL|nr:histidine kinase [Cellulomonas denverensis]NKY21280.1 sensor histidine kinase [Cellulomonas denverensis]
MRALTRPDPPSTPNPDDPRWRRAAPTPEQLRSDLLIAAVLFIGAVLDLALWQVVGLYDDPASGPVAVACLVATVLPLAFRRRWPSAVAVIVGMMFVITVSLQVSETLFINIALFMALYTVGAWESRRTVAFWVRAAVVTGMAVWLLVTIFQSVTDPDAIPGLSRAGAFSPMAAYLMSQVLTNMLYFSGAWYFGDHAWNAARDRARTRWRGRQLVTERRMVEEQAVSLERLRLARELHDAVAHHVSLMGVQAAAARVQLALDADGATRSLEQVEDSARAAIVELQGVLGTLREAGVAERPAPAVGSMTVEQLPTLVAQSTEAGVTATFQVIGDPQPLPPLLSLNLYRIAQEALTNTRKHAGEGARADVRLRYDDDAVELEVTDDGGGMSRRARLGGAGLGQVGMRERAAADGGTLVAGPRGRGGYLVRARVPLAAMRERDDR